MEFILMDNLWDIVLWVKLLQDNFFWGNLPSTTCSMINSSGIPSYVLTSCGILDCAMNPTFPWDTPWYILQWYNLHWETLHWEALQWAALQWDYL